MCRAGFADGIQIIAVLATFGLFLKEFDIVSAYY